MSAPAPAPVLQLDGDSHTWLMVRQYAQARIDTLTGVCTSPEASDVARRDSAMRIDELRQLLGAPDAAKRVSTSTPTHGSY